MYADSVAAGSRLVDDKSTLTNHKTQPVLTRSCIDDNSLPSYAPNILPMCYMCVYVQQNQHFLFSGSLVHFYNALHYLIWA